MDRKPFGGGSLKFQKRSVSRCAFLQVFMQWYCSIAGAAQVEKTTVIQSFAVWKIKIKNQFMTFLFFSVFISCLEKRQHRLEKGQYRLGALFSLLGLYDPWKERGTVLPAWARWILAVLGWHYMFYSSKQLNILITGLILFSTLHEKLQSTLTLS